MKTQTSQKQKIFLCDLEKDVIYFGILHSPKSIENFASETITINNQEFLAVYQNKVQLNASIRSVAINPYKFCQLKKEHGALEKSGTKSCPHVMLESICQKIYYDVYPDARVSMVK